jgi:hypothetical protein
MSSMTRFCTYQQLCPCHDDEPTIPTNQPQPRHLQLHQSQQGPQTGVYTSNTTTTSNTPEAEKGHTHQINRHRSQQHMVPGDQHMEPPMDRTCHASTTYNQHPPRRLQ